MYVYLYIGLISYIWISCLSTLLYFPVEHLFFVTFYDFVEMLPMIVFFQSELKESKCTKVVESICRVRLEISLCTTINSWQSLESLSLWALTNNMINYRFDYLVIWGLGLFVKLLFHYAESSNFYGLWSIKVVKWISVIQSWKIVVPGYLEQGNSEIIIMEVGWAWILVSFVKYMETIYV